MSKVCLQIDDQNKEVRVYYDLNHETEAFEQVKPFLNHPKYINYAKIVKEKE